MFAIRIDCWWLWRWKGEMAHNHILTRFRPHKVWRLNKRRLGRMLRELGFGLYVHQSKLNGITDEQHEMLVYTLSQQNSEMESDKTSPISQDASVIKTFNNLQQSVNRRGSWLAAKFNASANLRWVSTNAGCNSKSSMLCITETRHRYCNNHENTVPSMDNGLARNRHTSRPSSCEAQRDKIWSLLKCHPFVYLHKWFKGRFNMPDESLDLVFLTSTAVSTLAGRALMSMADKSCISRDISPCQSVGDTQKSWVIFWSGSVKFGPVI